MFMKTSKERLIIIEIIELSLNRAFEKYTSISLDYDMVF